MQMTQILRKKKNLKKKSFDDSLTAIKVEHFMI